MRRLRVVLALLFQVLLLQANVLGGGMGCAYAVTPAPSHATHHSGSHPAPHHEGAVPTHCATAAGCAAVVVASTEIVVGRIALVDPTPTSMGVSAPRWTRRAPEPPPPRV